jgi:pyruvate dehydrogenase E1 component alpha subunit
VVFVCENNQYAVTITAADSVAGPDIGDRACAYGIPGEVVDGNDVLAVHAAVAKAVNRAREGAGPSLVECKTWRWHGHCTGLPDRRDAEEIRYWTEECDPLPRFEQHLLDQQAITESELAQLRREASEAADEAAAFGEASSWPDPATVGEYLWA